MEGKEEGVKQR